MSGGISFSWEGSWGETGGKAPTERVLGIQGASFDWAVDQLIAGTDLAVWKDRVAAAKLVAPSATSQWPKVYESARKVVRFDGVSQRMDIDMDLSAPRTMIFVGRFGNAAASTYALTGGQGPSFNLYIGGNGNFAFYAGNTISSSKPGDTSNHVFIVVFDGANSVLRIDGTEWTGNAGSLVPTGIRIAATASAYSNVDMQRLALLPYAANAAERTALHAQMKKQYGL